MTIIVAIVGFLVLVLWSLIVLVLGFMSGKLAEKEAQQAHQHPEMVECTFANAIDNPAFSRLIQDKPLLKELLIVGSVSFLEITDETIEIAIALPKNHQEAINQAMQDAVEVNLVYEID